MASPLPIVLFSLAIYHLSVCNGELRTKVLSQQSVDPSAFKVIQSIPGCYQKVSMPSGKTGVTRAEAKSQCQASGFWLPDMFVRSDFNLAQTSALFGAASNRVDFWTGLTNLNSAILSCAGNACIGQGWVWEESSTAHIYTSHISFYDDESMNVTVNQSPCIKNHYYPTSLNSKHVLFSEPCTSQLTVILCQKPC